LTPMYSSRSFSSMKRSSTLPIFSPRCRKLRSLRTSLRVPSNARLCARCLPLCRLPSSYMMALDRGLVMKQTVHFPLEQADHECLVHTTYCTLFRLCASGRELIYRPLSAATPVPSHHAAHAIRNTPSTTHKYLSETTIRPRQSEERLESTVKPGPVENASARSS
jgi:hypothetical protein